MAPGTEFARYFCAGIDPLQLSVVLVLSQFVISPACIHSRCHTMAPLKGTKSFL